MAEASRPSEAGEDEEAGLVQTGKDDTPRRKDSGKKPADSEPLAAGRRWPCIAAQVLLLLGAVVVGFLLGRATGGQPLVPVAPAPAPAQAAAALQASPVAVVATTTMTSTTMTSTTRTSTTRTSTTKTSTSTATTTTTTAAPPRMRLVVNSHVKYSKPLGDLFQSLLQVHFQEPKPHFHEIVVIFGGSSREIGPYTAPGKWGKLGVTYINTTLNAFDYNALSSLYHYRDHPRVRARAYLYIHDTVLMTDDFVERFDKLASIIEEDELRIPITPSSNIFAIGNKVIARYGTNFDVNLTKGDAVDLEWGRGPVMSKVKHIRSFAKKLTQLPPRVPRGLDDPYHTGVKRHKYWYPDFGLNKFILMHFYGDIGGSTPALKPNYR